MTSGSYPGHSRVTPASLPVHFIILSLQVADAVADVVAGVVDAEEDVREELSNNSESNLPTRKPRNPKKFNHKNLMSMSKTSRVRNQRNLPPNGQLLSSNSSLRLISDSVIYCNNNINNINKISTLMNCYCIILLP